MSVNVPFTVFPTRGRMVLLIVRVSLHPLQLNPECPEVCSIVVMKHPDQSNLGVHWMQELIQRPWVRAVWHQTPSACCPSHPTVLASPKRWCLQLRLACTLTSGLSCLSKCQASASLHDPFMSLQTRTVWVTLTLPRLSASVHGTRLAALGTQLLCADSQKVLLARCWSLNHC